MFIFQSCQEKCLQHHLKLLTACTSKLNPCRCRPSINRIHSGWYTIQSPHTKHVKQTYTDATLTSKIKIQQNFGDKRQYKVKWFITYINAIYAVCSSMFRCIQMFTQTCKLLPVPWRPMAHVQQLTMRKGRVTVITTSLICITHPKSISENTF